MKSPVSTTGVDTLIYFIDFYLIKISNILVQHFLSLIHLSLYRLGYWNSLSECIVDDVSVTRHLSNNFPTTIRIVIIITIDRAALGKTKITDHRAFLASNVPFKIHANRTLQMILYSLISVQSEFPFPFRIFRKDSQNSKFSQVCLSISIPKIVSKLRMHSITLYGVVVHQLGGGNSAGGKRRKESISVGRLRT